MKTLIVNALKLTLKKGKGQITIYEVKPKVWCPLKSHIYLNNLSMYDISVDTRRYRVREKSLRMGLANYMSSLKNDIECLCNSKNN